MYLTAAHMAYLVMMAEFAKRGKTAEMCELIGRLEETLRSRFARPVEEMAPCRSIAVVSPSQLVPARVSQNPVNSE